MIGCFLVLDQPSTVALPVTPKYVPFLHFAAGKYEPNKDSVSVASGVLQLTSVTNRPTTLSDLPSSPPFLPRDDDYDGHDD